MPLSNNHLSTTGINRGISIIHHTTFSLQVWYWRDLENSISSTNGNWNRESSLFITRATVAATAVTAMITTHPTLDPYIPNHDRNHEATVDPLPNRWDRSLLKWVISAHVCCLFPSFAGITCVSQVMIVFWLFTDIGSFFWYLDDPASVPQSGSRSGVLGPLIPGS